MFGICIESSHQRGMGHLYRAIAFSRLLVKKQLAHRVFINAHCQAINALKAHSIPYDVVNLVDNENDWVEQCIKKYNITIWINDRLNTNMGQAYQVKKHGLLLVTFDDRGEGAHLSDINVAALCFDKKNELGGKLILSGPEFLILNDEISNYKKLRTKKEKILVTLGGSDTYGATIKIIKILKKHSMKATVILGPSFEHMNDLSEVIDSNFITKSNVPSLYKEFYEHDIAITGGGITPFEANASGMPCIVIANELFEVAVGKALQGLGGAVFAGYHTSIDESIFCQPIQVQRMSNAALKSVDLLGAERILSIIKTIH